MEIDIKCNYPPREYNNKNLTYSVIRTDSKLFVDIKDNGSVIGSGIVLDFYKKFQNRTDGTTLVYFESESFPKSAAFTKYGLFINNLKYLKHDLSDEEIDEIFAEICDKITNLKYLKDSKDAIITCIPSSSEIPQELMKEISKLAKIDSKDVISINTNSTQAKDNSIDEYEKKIEYLADRYIIEELENKKYIILDDVFGTGYSMAYICSEIYKKTGKPSLFFCICKDVKR